MNELEKMLEHIAKREISAVAEYAASHNLDIWVRDDETDWVWECRVWRAYPETYWIKEKLEAFDGMEIIDIRADEKDIWVEVR